MDRAAATRDLVGDLGLGHAAIDGVFDEFLVPLDTGSAEIFLRYQLAVGVV